MTTVIGSVIPLTLVWIQYAEISTGLGIVAKLFSLREDRSGEFRKEARRQRLEDVGVQRPVSQGGVRFVERDVRATCPMAAERITSKLRVFGRGPASIHGVVPAAGLDRGKKKCPGNPGHLTSAGCGR